MLSDPSIDILLRNCAWTELNGEVAEAIRRACLTQRHWQNTINEAELHGLSPYLYRSIKYTGSQVPAETKKTLKALTLRHSRSSEIRTVALLEIVKEIHERGIELLVLKGAALAHLIYDEPGLRPMSDIDVLVSAGQLQETADIATALGYRATDYNVLLADHHHMPNMSRDLDGLKVSLEIHHDALTPDNIGSIRVSTLSDPPREFMVDGIVLRTLGHLDMLRHLCRHALEPRETMKLGSALDIMLYASHYVNEIDWQRMKAEFPEVITVIQLLAYLVPWPVELDRFLRRPAAKAPQGVGAGMIPLSDLQHRRDRIAHLLNPSDWWLRGFYNVPPGRPLVYTKTVKHPLRVLHWLWRRKGKALG